MDAKAPEAPVLTGRRQGGVREASGRRQGGVREASGRQGELPDRLPDLPP
ncbi:hypothetical protein Ae717Ps2_6577 [Pseudonocardia sp. Ae717_Ps2]|nr:hypothetical protein Ae717Ps2_6577 [Pseudonocardia sp. Ae717_Ps2]